MNDHEKELPGLLEIKKASETATAASEAASASAAGQRATAHNAAKSALSTLTPEAAGYLALRLQEATHGTPAAQQRVLETLLELGVRIPAGFLP